MDLRALRLFVVIAEEGSIHAGARRLMITQPAVSQTLRKLEREVGGALVIRTSRGIQLTPAGVALLDHGRDILSRMDAASNLVRGIARTGNQVLRVGLMSGTASAGDLTFPIVAAFRERHPQVRLTVSDLSFDDQFEALVTGRVDVALVRPPCDDERLEIVDLFCEPTVLCFSVQHRLAEADVVSLNDVLDEPMVELVRAPDRWRAFWELNELRGGPPRRVHPEHAVTLSELQYTLLCEPVVAAAAMSAWQYGLSSPLLRAVPIVGAPPNAVAVAFRRNPVRAWAREFAACAREISEQMLDLVPGGKLITH
ncbi:MAG TPA: LysR family transcriptional regulator [Pseudonocardia sp.]|jgi:DNA-binding transcriptional LysR family regulator